MNKTNEELMIQYLKEILISLKKIEQYTVPYHVQVEEARRLIEQSRAAVQTTRTADDDEPFRRANYGTPLSMKDGKP